MSSVTGRQARISGAGLFHLLVIYIVWGSTYLAIRVGVRPDSGFTPFVFGSLRTLAAGLILLGLAAVMRQRIRPTRTELFRMVITGLLLWVGGNGLVMLGETRADSSLAALILAVEPIWVVLAEGIYQKRRPSLLLVASLLLGTAGIVVLSMPAILSGIRADLLAILIFVLASLCWSLGTVVGSHNPVTLEPGVASAYQMLAGGVGFGLIALCLGEPMPNPIPEAWAAWTYLLVFGSLLGFTSYVHALRMLPARLVITHGYVNPIIAIILGWLILQEPVTIWTVLGAGLVLLGVAGVFRDRARGEAN